MTITTTTTTGNTNTGCLEDLACPKCGQFERFFFDITARATVTDLGPVDVGELDWDDDSIAECPDCEWSGTVGELNSERVKYAATPDGLRARASELLDASNAADEAARAAEAAWEAAANAADNAEAGLGCPDCDRPAALVRADDTDVLVASWASDSAAACGFCGWTGLVEDLGEAAA